MGLFDRSTSNRVDLAETAPKMPVKRVSTSEIGVAGDSVIGDYNAVEQRSDTLTVQDYIKMRQTDGTVSGLYGILTLPILATNYSIEPGQEAGAEEQAEFVRCCAMRSRIVGSLPTGGLSPSGGTLPGGGGGGVPRIFSKIHLPRRTGDVRFA